MSIFRLQGKIIGAIFYFLFMAIAFLGSMGWLSSPMMKPFTCVWLIWYFIWKLSVWKAMGEIGFKTGVGNQFSHISGIVILLLLPSINSPGHFMREFLLVLIYLAIVYSSQAHTMRLISMAWKSIYGGSEVPENPFRRMALFPFGLNAYQAGLHKIYQDGMRQKEEEKTKGGSNDVPKISDQKNSINTL